MKKLFVVLLALFCVAVLISQWKLAKAQLSQRAAATAPFVDVSTSPPNAPNTESPANGEKHLKPLRRARMVPATPIGEPEQERTAETEHQPESDVRFNRLPAPGDFVVKWGERWWRAEVLKQNGGEKLIHYIGYGPEWDEWVKPDRAKVYSEADAKEEARQALILDSFIAATEQQEQVINESPRAPFEVEWNGSWYPAKVLREEGGKFLIHYEGYGDNWDEWVGVDRLRTTTQKAN